MNKIRKPINTIVVIAPIKYAVPVVLNNLIFYTSLYNFGKRVNFIELVYSNLFDKKLKVLKVKIFIRRIIFKP